MRIVFALERPSQFDAPLFRLAGSDPEHDFEAWFTAPDPEAVVSDPELGRNIDWGFDRISGYCSALVPTLGVRRWVGERLWRERADLVIVNGYTRRSYLEIARASRAEGVPVALRIDSARFPSDRPPSAARRWLLGGALRRRFDRFLTTGSCGLAYLLAMGIPSARIGRFPYAVDHRWFAREAREARQERQRQRAQLGVPPEAQVVLALTKFSQREAPRDLIEARAALPRPDLWWVLAGDGALRGEFVRQVGSRGLDRVVFPGYVPYQELPRVYAAADLFVHPVREERWGVSVAEALACGLPVVASDRVGAAHDLVVPGENGVLCSAGGAALSSAIEVALGLDRDRAAAASARRLEEFGLEATWRGLLDAAASVQQERRA